jgi:DNA repair exonuclease SbcCD ATPase subunit
MMDAYEIEEQRIHDNHMEEKELIKAQAAEIKRLEERLTTMKNVENLEIKQLEKLLNDALPHIDCRNHEQNNLITEIGQALARKDKLNEKTIKFREEIEQLQAEIKRLEERLSFVRQSRDDRNEIRMKPLWIIFALSMLFWLLCLSGCSHTEQRATLANAHQMIDLKVSKTSFLYWSRFSADTDTFGMTMSARNVESGVDMDVLEQLLKRFGMLYVKGAE